VHIVTTHKGTGLDALASDTTMNRAGKTLWEKDYKGGPVLDNEKLVGILSRKNLIQSPTPITDGWKILMTEIIARG